MPSINPRKSMDSINPFSQSMGTDKDPTHLDLNTSGKWFKQPAGSDGDGLLAVHRRKRTRKHKNRTENIDGDSNVIESPKMKSNKLVSFSAERKMNGTIKPTANKHVR